MINVLKRFLEEKLDARFMEKGSCLYSPVSNQVNFDSLYSAIAELVREIEYSANEISAGDGSADQRAELEIWKRSNFFRLKLYYAGNMMAIQFY